MKKLILILSLLPFIGLSQTITNVGLGEYNTVFKTSTGLVYFSDQSSIIPIYKSYVGLSDVVSVAGAQYTCLALTSTGSVYKLQNNTSTPSLVGNDYIGNPFTGVSKVAGFYETYLAIKNDSIWYWGADSMLYNGRVTVAAPFKLTQPVGKLIKKVQGVSNIGFSVASKIWALATDGTLWVYSRSSTIPTQVIISGEVVKDFECVGFAAIAAITVSNKIYAWGNLDSRYAGAATHSLTPIDITTRWSSVGVAFPIKELKGNFESLHIIDANDNLFASGSNPQGNAGNGIEYTPMRTNNNGGGSAFLWDIALNSYLITAPVQIRGKFKNFQSDQTISFYAYVQDLGNNWYALGRQKSFSIANGISLYPFQAAAVANGTSGSYDNYPNALDIPMFKKVNLNGLTWTLRGFNPNDSIPPVTSAGINQYITTATTTLYGKSFQQEHQIASYAWTKISGTGGAIITSNAATTDVNLLSTGTYVFRLTSTNTNGQSTSDDVTVVVNNTSTIGNLIISSTKYKN